MASTQPMEIMSPEWFAYNEYLISCARTACRLAGVEYGDWHAVAAAVSDDEVHATLRFEGYDSQVEDYFDLHRLLVIEDLRTVFELTELTNG